MHDIHIKLKSYKLELFRRVGRLIISMLPVLEEKLEIY